MEAGSSGGEAQVIPLPRTGRDLQPDGFLSDVLTAWKRQQAARNLSLGTIDRRIKSVLRLADFAGTFPWQWLPRDAEDFFAHLRGVQGLSHSTVRAYQSDIRAFFEFAVDPAYDWNDRCGREFGQVMVQVVVANNSARHAQETPEPSKRPFSAQELQDFFDLADMEPDRVLAAHRKGALAAWRDAVAFKVIYGWGLRHNEARHLLPADFSRNARAPMFGDWGLLRVRHGKAMPGSPPKQRTVLTVFDWAATAVDQWCRSGLPRYGLGRSAPLFPTDSGGMIDQAYLRRRFRSIVEELELPPGLDIHSLRRTYATNLQIDMGMDVSFVQMQLGHEHASTTAIYTIASHDYRSRHLDRILSDTLRRSGVTEVTSHRVV